MNTGKIHIGTSGWYYDHWQSIFYPEDIPKNRWLEYYIKIFSTVELNNTFYHYPRKKTLEHWRSVGPPGFKYSVKAHRSITHYKKMRDIQDDLKKFLHMIKPLGEALGPILYQLPPSLHADPSLLTDLFEIHPTKYRYVLEFRHDSWFTEDTYELLRRNNVAFCVHDHNKRKIPFVCTADFVYIRLHGPDGNYGGDYSIRFLHQLAEQILIWSGEGFEVFCYFNNDSEGYAVKNAVQLLKMAEVNSSV